MRFKNELIEFEFGETQSDLPSVGKMYVKDEIEELQTLAKAIRYNHDISDFNKINMTVNQEWELDNHDLKITQLTLPHRFGMYREQKKGVPITTFVEIEDPTAPSDDFQERELDDEEMERRGTKIRRIFE